MTSRSEAEALRKLIKTLERLSREHAEAESDIRFRLLTRVSVQEDRALEALLERHAESHRVEADRLYSASLTYETMLANIEERELASQDNQSE